MSVLAFDPSKRATGWVLTSGNTFRFGTLEFNKQKGIKATPEKMLFQQWVAKSLEDLIIAASPIHIVSEFPFGSKSAAAAWYLGMITQSITSASIHLLQQKPVFILPYDARKNMLGDGHADKDKVRAAMLSYVNHRYPDGYRHLAKQAKFRQEAICDALLIEQFYNQTVKYTYL